MRVTTRVGVTYLLRGGEEHGEGQGKGKVKVRAKRGGGGAEAEDENQQAMVSGGANCDVH